MQLAELAHGSNSSLSRLSHLMRRMEARGLVTRYPLATNGRITVAELTPVGLETLKAAAPGHVEQSRQLIFDRLSTQQVAQLGDICRALAAKGEFPLKQA